MSTRKTLGALALLAIPLPANAALTGAALLRGLLAPPPRTVAADPKTVLLSGGKMTKALTLARAFHRAGHRVVLVEGGPYRLTGHRFSRCVDAFHTTPMPGAPGYAEALVEIAVAEGVDVYVPVCSPAASYHDAVAKGALEAHCEVLHLDPGTVATLDDKEAFTALAASLGLPVPDAHRITDPRQVEDFDFAASGRTYLLKSLGYDPVHRLDLTRLPRSTPAETSAFVRSLPISPDNPWVLQEFLDGQEYCAHSTVRDGAVQVWVCCESSAFQVNYAAVDKPVIEDWVRRFVGALGLTGQVSFDLIETTDGRVLPIECNPRTHSAITLFAGHPGLAAAYLEGGRPTITPLPASRPTYWTYHELWRLLRDPGRLRVLLAGRDAIFDPDDPLPFLLEHHLQIPALLLRSLRARTDWIRIDFNIGKLVQPAGD